MTEFKNSGEFATTWVGGLGLIQGEEIVRYRDCKHLNKLSRKHEAYACCLTCMEVPPYGFCIWGERRTNDN